MALTGEQFHIAAGDFEATVVEVGAGLRRFARAGQDVAASYPEDQLPPKGCGCLLAPWPNRLRGGRYSFAGQDYQLGLTEPAAGNAIHGLTRWSRWLLVGQRAEAVTLGCDIVPQTGWPFEVRVEVEYALDAARGLSVTARATNHGATSAPFGIGFHPYLATGGDALDDVTVLLAAAQRLVTDGAQIPTGAEDVAGTRYDLRAPTRLGSLRLDDAFTDLAVVDGRSAVEVRTSSGGARLWMDAAFGYAQIFTPEALADGRTGVAVEPMTCPANAFNSGDGLIVLGAGGQPDSDWQASWGIQPL